ncbi:MAG: phosphoribosyl-AMP cyclohydrolase [Candidatus Binatus sp.]|uniref:phosphoribosyl-AMP cyclohydrolase n=1 Tax=Candidatus Binatus sp. TaxID=2811406 RepID=UPI002728F192|nr:phosphoribosyl-AMP cyclohydrolase [Candidatus Binatus sp.]MDO8434256.1 phosphoribosyl-AMP cyclohydrolase [Candidatus Binatus sp.]
MSNPTAAAASALIDFDKQGGVVPAIAVDHRSHRVLTVAFMNRDALDETIATGRACYFSRSRSKLWRKGEESGNFQIVHEIRIDCDADAIVIAVEARGDAAACHLGYESCFFRKLDNGEWQITDDRKVDPTKYGPGYGHQKKSAG